MSANITLISYVVASFRPRIRCILQLTRRSGSELQGHSSRPDDLTQGMRRPGLQKMRVPKTAENLSYYRSRMEGLLVVLRAPLAGSLNS